MRFQQFLKYIYVLPLNKMQKHFTCPMKWKMNYSLLYPIVRQILNLLICRASNFPKRDYAFDTDFSL